MLGPLFVQYLYHAITVTVKSRAHDLG